MTNRYVFTCIGHLSRGIGSSNDYFIYLLFTCFPAMLVPSMTTSQHLRVLYHADVLDTPREQQITQPLPRVSIYHITSPGFNITALPSHLPKTPHFPRFQYKRLPPHLIVHSIRRASQSVHLVPRHPPRPSCPKRRSGTPTTDATSALSVPQPRPPRTPPSPPVPPPPPTSSSAPTASSVSSRRRP